MNIPSWSTSPFWGTFWGQLLGDILGAFVFLFLILLLLRPKVRIAPFLCKISDNYHFKFVNVSIFDAHDIKAELYEIRKVPMGNGDFNNTYRKLALQNGEIAYLPKRPLLWQKNKDYPHCMTVRTSEDISGILSDETAAVLIRVSLRHGLTGLSSVFEQDYAGDQQIKTSKYKPGSKFDVIG